MVQQHVYMSPGDTDTPGVDIKRPATAGRGALHTRRRNGQAAVAVAAAAQLYGFYDRARGKARVKARRKAAVRALQSTWWNDLTDAPEDMKLVATASTGLIPASVVLKDREAVLDWVETDVREPWSCWVRLIDLLHILKVARETAPTVPRPPQPPTGLRTRSQWVQQYPQVLESFLTNPETGEYRSTRERYILARTPVGAALLLGARRI